MSISFGAFERAAPGLAARARERLHLRTSYLGTVRSDGTPRVHPVTPGIGGGFPSDGGAATELFVFMEPTSPKGLDLERGSHFALHCGVEDNSGGGGEVLVTGTAERVTDAGSRAAATAAWEHDPEERYVLFVLRIAEVRARSYGADGPVSERWRAPS